jgi:hypothetical protein
VERESFRSESVLKVSIDGGNQMATESEYLVAIARVKYGNANQHDYELCNQAAKKVGSLGDKARDALKNAKR